MRNVLRGGDRTADNKDISTGLERILDNIRPDAASGCHEQLAAGCLLECRFLLLL